MGDRSVPLGKYCLSSRLVFSFVPRCQGLCGSQKYTFTSVATVNALCLAISKPRSHVSERRNVAGSLRTRRLRAATTASVFLLGTCRLRAATTASVFLLGTLTSTAKRE